ncbi:MAG: alanine--tRNA ligase [Actinobacteria bacterium]|nr:alanine--tRNA ligase [Actinomycetota bacterium]
MRTTAELREGFSSFFESKGHLRHPSFSLIPRPDDHSTLLTTAGMQPLMPYFLGRESPPAPLLTTAQKSFRTPDIDEVGLDGTHLTFFEMLGNFSFGQYFKEGAVELAWEFVFDHMKIDPDCFWVTVFAGDPELGLEEDTVAVDLWERIGLPPERIRRLGRADNFWSVGGPGPCGPDSELFFDRGPELGCERPDCGPGCSCERYLEFWNLVFMEYELHADGTLTRLPQQNVDTGMGLERAASVLQGVTSVYDTDGYQTIMDWIAAESGVAYGDSEQATKAHRVLADHGRGMTFLAADGVTPGNEGRGYVLRRIVRRAVQQGRRIGLEGVYRLPAVVVEQMGDVYPELREHAGQIERIVRAEEERFGETLARGLRVFEELAGSRAVTAEQAFTLATTYGFPIELTVELAEERGQPVDVDEYGRLLEEHRTVSRAGGEPGELQRAAEFARASGESRSDFVGYEKTEVLTTIAALEALEDGLFQAKLHESPFYPEGGGQVSDRGFVEHEGTGTRAELVKAVRVGEDQVLTLRGEGFAVGDRVRAVVPWSVRFPTAANHTATHLLHAALREVLGEHVQQAGSAVRPDKLRFDFTHGQALSPDERDAVERRVNEKVFEGLPVRTFVTPIAEARRLGATMLFGEKYGEDVRVVEIPTFSRELCGGTHVRSTAEVGPFVLLSEGSVGSGVRRIEAVTSGEAFARLRAGGHEAEELRGELERRRRERPAAGPAPASEAPELPTAQAVVEGVHVIVQQVDGLDADQLLELSDRAKQRAVPAAVVLGSQEDGKVHLVANFDRSLEERGLDAGRLIREVAAVVGGGGGGRPTMARAGGKHPDRLPEALSLARRLVEAALA